MTDERRPVMTPHLIVGLFIIAIGVLFTLDNLGLVQATRYLRFWPIVLVVIGVLKLSAPHEGTHGSFGGFVFILAGAWLLLEETTLIRVSFWDLWPMLLVFFGAYLVWQGATGRQHRTVSHSTDTISAFAILGGVARGNNSRNFRGGDLTAIMGGCEVDLRRAAINGDATIEIFVMWGGVEIRVPEDWTVISRVNPVLGGFDDKTRPPQGLATHRLTVRGIALMGGIEVKN